MSLDYTFDGCPDCGKAIPPKYLEAHRNGDRCWQRRVALSGRMMIRIPPAADRLLGGAAGNPPFARTLYMDRHSGRFVDFENQQARRAFFGFARVMAAAENECETLSGASPQAVTKLVDWVDGELDLEDDFVHPQEAAEKRAGG